MKIGFVVNSIEGRKAGMTTVGLAMHAHARGHEVWFVNAADLTFDADGRIRAWGTIAPAHVFKSTAKYLAALTGEKGRRDRITVDQLDVVMLRLNPAVREGELRRAASTALTFARAVTRHGTIVLNDPLGLQAATNKLYFHLFPPEVAPRTIITHDRDDVRAFADDVGDIVLKPLEGSGGQSVFLVRREERSNLNQMIDAVSRDGWIIAQEFLPASADGDTRLVMMNGAPLRVKGRYAAMRRQSAGDDLRTNTHAGGSSQPATVTQTHLDLAEIVGPRLARDGIFLAGLDIIGDKIIEINVQNPGGLMSARRHEGVNFFGAVVDDLERKVRCMKTYSGDFSNCERATL